MDPIATVKQNLSIPKIVGGAIVLVAVLAIADAAGVTNWILFPVTTAKAKFAKSGN